MQQHPSLFFDREHAEQYDERFARLASLRDTLHLLVAAAFADLPEEARIVCVGAGTGAEVIALAERFPGWTFTAVEPSAPMLAVCRRRTAEAGVSDRCVFHEGFLETLPVFEPFDAATSLLVSQFILSPEERARFFREIARRLRPGGRYANADLAGDTAAPHYPAALRHWMRLMKGAEVPVEAIARMRETYERDVAIWPPEKIAAAITAGGFEAPAAFFQAGLIHAWHAVRSPLDC